MDLRERLREGVAYTLTPPQWLRGPAVIDGDHVVLEERQRETYQPHVHPYELLLDLAGVDSRHDILGFVRKHGLLWHGPDADEHRESLEDWAVATGWLRWTLLLYADLGDFVDGDESRFDAVRTNELVRVFAGGEPPVYRDELKHLASEAVSHAITAGLGEVRVNVVAASETSYTESRPGEFSFLFDPANLLGHAYAEAAHLIVQRAPLTQCPECGRLFAVEHGRQKFCTPTCAGRARQRRFAERHKREESPR